MRSTRVAEWMLSLVTTRDRAASMVGDWVEDGNHGSAVRFWAAVVHSTLSLLAQDLALNPARMVWLATLGVLFECGGGIAIFFVLLLVDPNKVTQMPPGMPLRLTGLPALLVLAAGLLLQFQVGRVLAKRSSGRELAPCIALTIAGWTIGWTLQLIGGRFAPAGAALTPGFESIPSIAVLLAGAILVRRRHQLAVA